MIEQIVIIFLVTIISLYVCYPYFFSDINKNGDDFEGISDIERLNKKKALYISELKDIEFDYGLGKLSDEDYKELIQTYKVKAADAMEKADKIKEEADSTSIEEEVLKYRKTKDS